MMSRLRLLLPRWLRPTAGESPAAARRLPPPLASFSAAMFLVPLQVLPLYAGGDFWTLEAAVKQHMPSGAVGQVVSLPALAHCNRSGLAKVVAPVPMGIRRRREEDGRDVLFELVLEGHGAVLGRAAPQGEEHTDERGKQEAGHEAAKATTPS